jgi:hypothetical protein
MCFVCILYKKIFSVPLDLVVVIVTLYSMYMDVFVNISYELIVVL